MDVQGESGSRGRRPRGSGGPDAKAAPWPARGVGQPAPGGPRWKRMTRTRVGAALLPAVPQAGAQARVGPDGPRPARSALTAGPPRVRSVGSGHLAGRRHWAGEVPWGTPGRFLPGLPPLLPSSSRSVPSKDTGTLHLRTLPAGSQPLFTFLVRVYDLESLPAPDSWDAGAGQGSDHLCGFLVPEWRSSAPLEVILKVTQEVGVRRGEEPRHLGVPSP